MNQNTPASKRRPDDEFSLQLSAEDFADIMGAPRPQPPGNKKGGIVTSEQWPHEGGDWLPSRNPIPPPEPPIPGLPTLNPDGSWPNIDFGLGSPAPPPPGLNPDGSWPTIDPTAPTMGSPTPQPPPTGDIESPPTMSGGNGGGGQPPSPLYDPDIVNRGRLNIPSPRPSAAPSISAAARDQQGDDSGQAAPSMSAPAPRIPWTHEVLADKPPSFGETGQGGDNAPGSSRDLIDAIEDLTEQTRRVADLMEKGDKGEGVPGKTESTTASKPTEIQWPPVRSRGAVPSMG